MYTKRRKNKREVRYRANMAGGGAGANSDEEAVCMVSCNPAPTSSALRIIILGTEHFFPRL
jgi:hypothetical protein